MAAGPPGPHRLQLLLAGDVMTGRGIDQVLPHAGAPELFEGWVRDARDYVALAERLHGAIARPVAPAYPWGEALAAMDRFASALRIVNLETAIAARGAPWPGKGIHYRMHPDNLDCLRSARLSACSLANNHVLDWGYEGLADTLAALDAAGIPHAGAGLDEAQARRPCVLPVAGGGRVLLSAWAAPDCGVPPQWAAGPARPGVALLPDLSLRSAQAVAEAVAAVRLPGDRVVVSLHWGGNWGFALPQEHVDFAHALVDLGAADVVHGHSSHHPLPVEVYRGRAILHGCGDLINDYEGIGAHDSLRSDAACLYALALAPDGTLQAMDIIPLRLRRLRLERADADARRWLRRIFEEEGRAFGTDVAEASDGSFSLCW